MAAVCSPKVDSGVVDISKLDETTTGTEEISPSFGSLQDETKLEVIMASDYGGWHMACNRILARHLASNRRLRFRAFVPRDHPRRAEIAENVELLENEKLPGYFPIELLDYSHEELQHLDFLIMHCYGRDLGKQAEEICRNKKCKWIPVVHRDWVELTKFFEVAGVSLAGRADNHQEERQRQIELCINADFIVTIGPKVAEPFLNALQPYRKDMNVVSITPEIFSELNPVSRISENQDTFNVLIVAEYPYLSSYFLVKGCDIAVKALLLLQDRSYHLMVVMTSSYGVSELTQTLLSEGMQQNQFTVKTTYGDDPVQMAQFLNEADLLLLPSRVEGFGMSGIYAISAGLPVLISVYSGLGVALKKLPSGGKQVVDSDDPQVWAQKIKEIRAKDHETTSFETRQLREEYMQKYSWEDQCNKLVEKMMMGNVPTEILARGPKAIKAYQKAIEEGTEPVIRVPIMIIGQERSGKTSLKNSLKGQLFNPKEESTDGIERDSSHFSVTTEIWRTGETKQGPDSDSAVSFHNRVARAVVDNLKAKEATEEIPPAQSVKITVGTKDKEAVHLPVVEDVVDVVPLQTERPASQFGNLPRKIRKEEFTVKQELPPLTANCVAKLLKESKKTADERVYSILWDFGGQSVYYATHPIFLTTKALYVLAYNLSKIPEERAPFVSKEGVFGSTEDIHCTKTNEDYLHLWLSSISNLPSESGSSGSKKLPEMLPPVILVCTHADQCGVDAEGRAKKLYGTLRSCSKHLSNTYFVVDNTKSGSGDECLEVRRLREELLAVAKELLQMRTHIPIKWLSFEEALKDRVKEGKTFIDLKEARSIALEECRIDDDEQFVTLLNFLHDQRIIIHFDESPKMRNMVILDPQWLIDLFRKVITVKPYDRTAAEEYDENMWKNLQFDGILDAKLLQTVWGPLLHEETMENLIAIMEKFSLLCSLPSVNNQKQYLVPAALNSPPVSLVNDLLSEAFISPLFIRFKRQRSLRHPGDHTDSEHLPVPLGLFPRLVVKFLRQSIKEEIYPLYQNIFLGFAKFPILPKGYSVILNCRSSCIQVIVQKELQTAIETTIGHEVRLKLGAILQSLQEECFWLKSMEYEFCVICSVCCSKYKCSANYCKQHLTEDCEKEGCLHFWSESALQKKPECKSTFATNTLVPVQDVSPWFKFPWIQVKDIDEFVLSFGDSLVKDNIVANVHIMDELARGLDQPIYRGEQEPPVVQHWVHLAAEFTVPEDVVTKCQTSPQSSSSKHMFEFLEARNPNYSVKDLKEGLSVISRNDLVKKVELCGLTETSSLRVFRQKHHSTFDTICLQLDRCNNWKALGLNINIPDETLQQIATSTSCTKTVIEIIENRKPHVTVKEMQDVLRGMQREDVCNVLDKYLPGGSTLKTLRNNLDCLGEVTTLLDCETPGMKNWLHFACKLGVPKEDCDNLKPKGNPSPTRALMEHIVQVDPGLTVKTFIEALKKMQRIDVVNALWKLFLDHYTTTKQDSNGKDSSIDEEGL